MADRITGKRATVWADLRGYTDETINVTLLNPYGTELESGEATGNGSGRYSYTSGNTLDISGVWTAEYRETDDTLVQSQEFTVGPRTVFSRSLYDLRVDVARRVVSVHEGYLLDANENSFADPGLIGGSGDWEGFWVVLDPESDDKGRSFRVKTYNGSTLEVAGYFWSTPSDNDRYALMYVYPGEVDRAINVAIQDLAYLSRIQLTLSDVPVPDDNLIDLPDYLSHVTEVWIPDDDEGLVRAAQTAWDTKPGRQLYVDTDEDTVDITVLGTASVPVWEDSLVDIEPAVLIARAAQQLHANRAGSSTIDLEEHLRRQLAAQQEFEENRRSGIGRIPPGSRKIID